MSPSASRNLVEAAFCLLVASSRAVSCSSFSRRPRSSAKALAIVGKFSFVRKSGLRSVALLPEHLANAVGLVALLLGQSAGFVRKGVNLRGSLLLAHAAQQIRGFLQAIGGAARFGFALLRRRRATHVIGSLPEPVERLLDARVRRAGFSSRARLAGG